MDELKSSISQLYSGLNVELYQLEREHQLKTQLDELEQQIEPYEQVSISILVCLSLYVRVCVSVGLCMSVCLSVYMCVSQ